MLPDPNPVLDERRTGPPVPLLVRVIALLEVVICSDFLTQIALGGTLSVFGFQPYLHGRLSVAYVVGLSLADAIFLIGLVLILLYAHGERPREVLLGPRPVVGEVAAGLPMILLALGVAIVVLLGVRHFPPSLPTVEPNPLQELLRSPRDAPLFPLVVLIAAAIPEEIHPP